MSRTPTDIHTRIHHDATLIHRDALTARTAIRAALPGITSTPTDGTTHTTTDPSWRLLDLATTHATDPAVQADRTLTVRLARTLNCAETLAWDLHAPTHHPAPHSATQRLLAAITAIGDTIPTTPTPDRTLTRQLIHLERHTQPLAQLITTWATPPTPPRSTEDLWCQTCQAAGGSRHPHDNRRIGTLTACKWAADHHRTTGHPPTQTDVTRHDQGRRTRTLVDKQQHPDYRRLRHPGPECEHPQAGTR